MKDSTPTVVLASRLAAAVRIGGVNGAAQAVREWLKQDLGPPVPFLADEGFEGLGMQRTAPPSSPDYYRYSQQSREPMRTPRHMQVEVRSKEEACMVAHQSLKSLWYTRCIARQAMRALRRSLAGMNKTLEEGLSEKAGEVAGHGLGAFHGVCVVKVASQDLVTGEAREGVLVLSDFDTGSGDARVAGGAAGFSPIDFNGEFTLLQRRMNVHG